MKPFNFWKGKKVLVTGHTGFKGSWLCLWLTSLGAQVTGYALKPPTRPSLFRICGIEKMIRSVEGDIADSPKLKKVFKLSRPQIVIHMAAQPLVRGSYINPLETYATNVMGTVNLFEAIAGSQTVRAAVNVTTDKCYENFDLRKSFKESEPLGGYDPYSSSKACSEIITNSYRNSYFNPKDYGKHKVAIATARAGNVIGGGDWGQDRLIPDFVRAVLRGKKVRIRNPRAVRPWQHVLDPLSGYLLLSQKLYQQGSRYGQAWNFGPDCRQVKNVEWVIKRMCQIWPKAAGYTLSRDQHPHEAGFLKLNCSKAKKQLGWQPKWNLEKSLKKTVQWLQAYQKKSDMKKVCYSQIEEFQKGR